MYPQPLIGIAADILFNNLCKESRISNHVTIVISSSNQIYRGLKAQAIFAQRGVPDCESRNNSSISAQGDPCHSTGRTSWDAKKIHKHTLWRSHVCVHENPHSFSVLHC